MMEQWDLLDSKGQPTGRTIVRGEPLRAGQYHLVEHIWILDAKGRILIQRRADHLRLMPGVWAANSGSAMAGESSEDAARRELMEELSIRVAPGELVYGGRMRRRNSFTDVWLLYRDIDPSALRLQKEEVAEVRWVTPEELTDMIGNRTFHHYGGAYFQFVFRAMERGRRTLYITDLDGTLMRNDETISPYTEETLNRLISRGMMISVATARGLVGIELVQLGHIRFRVPLVLQGGVLIYDTVRRRILHCCEMSAATVATVLRVFREEGRHPLLYRRRGNEVHIYYTSLNPAEEAFVNRVANDGRRFDRFYHRVDILRDSPAIFFSCQDTYENQTRLKERLDAIPGIRAVMYRDIYREDNWFVEISRDDAGKDKGVERLCRRLKIQRLVAFGDGNNDVPLLRLADLGCCVANGSDTAREAADLIIGTNEEDGVAQYLNAIYNRKL